MNQSEYSIQKKVKKGGKQNIEENSKQIAIKSEWPKYIKRQKF